jgi:hypothetical protein
MKQYQLYNHTIFLNFDEEKHLYTVNNKMVDGTTSVLGVINKPALMYWAVNQCVSFFQGTIKPGVTYDEIQLKAMAEQMKSSHRKKSGDAADIGKMVHEWIDDYISGKKPPTPVNEKIKNATNSFLEWVKKDNVKFIENERIVYSKKYNYAGTLDFVAEVNGKLLLGDFKTSSGIWDEYWFQTSAYQQAYTEEFPEAKILGQAIVRIGKDGVLEVKISEAEDYEPNRIAFNSALNLHRRLKYYKDKAYQEKQNKEKV